MQQKGHTDTGVHEQKPWVGDPGRQHWPCATSICPQDQETHGGSSGRVVSTHLELRFGLGKSLWAVSCVPKTVMGELSPWFVSPSRGHCSQIGEMEEEECQQGGICGCLQQLSRLPAWSPLRPWRLETSAQSTLLSAEGRSRTAWGPLGLPPAELTWAHQRFWWDSG